MTKSFLRTGGLTVALLACGSLFAAVTHTERFTRDFPLGTGASLWVENPVGDTEIIGVDGDTVSVSVVKFVNAPDAATLAEGREQTQVYMGGDGKAFIVRTIVAPPQTAKWKSTVSYVIRVPRVAQVHLVTAIADHVRIAGVAGAVTVKNFGGDIVLENVAGATTVDTTNGDIHFITDARPSSAVQLSTINGGIEVQVSADSNLDWIAQSLSGDLRTNFPVKGRFSGNGFRGLVNGLGGPTFATTAVMGNIFMLKRGGRQDEIKSLHLLASGGAPPPAMQKKMTIDTPVVQGNIIYLRAADIVSFNIGEVRGFANLATGAGQVTLGSVTGDLTVRSGGGPLEIGAVNGIITAHTDAGEVNVGHAYRGGEISTSGGTLQVTFAGGPLVLQNGGGDIIVRQAVSRVSALTRSGDVTIGLDSNSHSQRVIAKTTKGNVLLTIGQHFGAEVDATVLTSNEETNPIHADFPGLTIKRDQFNGKTRLHATGKIGAGGEKVELYSEEGEIRITQK